MLNDDRLYNSFLQITLTCVITVGTLALVIGTASGYISPWTGRFYSLLDPTYAKDHIPIIASVSEHQPTAWSSFMFDFQILLFLFPAGLYFCFKRLSDATIFIVMYGLTSMYFAGVMVRLILVAAPAVCLISAIAASATIKNLTTLIRTKSKSLQAASAKTTGSKAAAKVFSFYFFLSTLLNFILQYKTRIFEQRLKYHTSSVIQGLQIRRIRWWPIFQKSALFTKKIGTVQTK
jgi:dolichyl-diphosphooligosaccharide---protein glycosyltransferase